MGTCARQIGAVLGIAVLLSGIDAGGPGAFRVAWWAMVGTALATAVCGVVVGAVRATRTGAPLVVPVPVLRPIEETR